MRVALFGGTFDPPHNGHIAVAGAALQDARIALDQLIFVPAERPPHKEYAITAFEHRMRMACMAAAALGARAKVSDMESRAITGSDAPNYTIDTVRRFKAASAPETEVFVIVGADSFLQLGTWKDPAALLREAGFIIVNRPGTPLEKVRQSLPQVAPEGGKIFLLEGVAEDISASAIRKTVAAGGDITSAVPAAVEDYIEQHQLYRA